MSASASQAARYSYSSCEVLTGRKHCGQVAVGHFVNQGRVKAVLGGSLLPVLGGSLLQGRPVLLSKQACNSAYVFEACALVILPVTFGWAGTVQANIQGGWAVLCDVGFARRAGGRRKLLHQ